MRVKFKILPLVFCYFPGVTWKYMFNFIKNIGPTELILIALVVVILFGGKIATRLGKASGETLREIKKVKKSFTDAVGGDDVSSN